MLDLHQSDVAFAVNAVRECAQLARRVQAGMAMRGLTKSDFSPVTVSDYVIQALVSQRLFETQASAALVAEERSSELKTPEGRMMLELVTEYVNKVFPDTSPETVCDWIDRGAAAPLRRFWTLDPIDGTQGYMRGGQYAVALALVEDGQVRLGVLACPNLNTQCEPEVLGLGALLVAQRGAGAWITDLDDAEAIYAPLHVSTCAETENARLLRSVEAVHTNATKIDVIAETLGLKQPPVLMDSMAKYALLAGGKGELMMRLLSPAQPHYKEKIWDHAASSIVLEEAGGRVTDLHGKPLDFSTGAVLSANCGIFASNGLLHDAGLEAIAQAGA